MRSQQGLTLIEMLVSTVILGVLITVVLAPLGQFFQSTARTGQTLRATTQAQEVVEYIRGQWQSYPVVMVADPANSSNQLDQNVNKRTASQNRYNRNCYAEPAQVSGLTRVIEVRALDRNASSGSALTLSTDCTSAALSSSPPPMKRINVTLTAADGSRSSLTLDVPRP